MAEDIVVEKHLYTCGTWWQSCVVLSVDVASSERGGKNCGLASGLRVLFLNTQKTRMWFWRRG